MEKKLREKLKFCLKKPRNYQILNVLNQILRGWKVISGIKFCPEWPRGVLVGKGFFWEKSKPEHCRCFIEEYLGLFHFEIPEILPQIPSQWGKNGQEGPGSQPFIPKKFGINKCYFINLISLFHHPKAKINFFFIEVFPSCLIQAQQAARMV